MLTIRNSQFLLLENEQIVDRVCLHARERHREQFAGMTSEDLAAQIRAAVLAARDRGLTERANLSTFALLSVVGGARAIRSVDAINLQCAETLSPDQQYRIRLRLRAGKVR